MSAVEPITVATFRLQYEDDYEYEFSVLSTRFRLEGENFQSARAQNLKLVLVVFLELQSEGRQCHRPNHDLKERIQVHYIALYFTGEFLFSTLKCHLSFGFTVPRKKDSPTLENHNGGTIPRPGMFAMFCSVPIVVSAHVVLGVA